MTAYKKKLQDQRWLTKRAEILIRDKHTCQHPGCSKSDGLQIHHTDYIPSIDPWDYPNDMLLTLCQLHHGKELHRKKVENQLFTAFKMKGFLLSDLLHLSTKLHYDEVFTVTLLNKLREDAKRNILV
jgi:hypothetical protein